LIIPFLFGLSFRYARILFVLNFADMSIDREECADGLRRALKISENVLNDHVATKAERKPALGLAVLFAVAMALVVRDANGAILITVLAKTVTFRLSQNIPSVTHGLNFIEKDKIGHGLQPDGNLILRAVEQCGVQDRARLHGGRETHTGRGGFGGTLARRNGFSAWFRDHFVIPFDSGKTKVPNVERRGTDVWGEASSFVTGGLPPPQKFQIRPDFSTRYA